MREINRYYYTLWDLVKGKSAIGEINTNLYLGTVVADEFKNTIKWAFNLNDTTIQGINADLLTTEANTLWCKYILPYYGDEYIMYNDDSDISIIWSFGPAASWLKQYVAIFINTYTKYKKLIELYDSQKNNLLNSVGSSTTIRFNDTPQNGGDFTSDNYTSTYTKTDNEIKDVPIERLEEINKLYDDMYVSWAKEFNTLFMESPEVTD